MKKYTKQQRIEAFWVKVEKTSSCWNWLGYIKKDGYPAFRYNEKMGNAYRFSYELFKGDIPEGLQIDHLCRNRSCVNPAHLEAVTRKINLLRGDTFQAKNAAKTHCPKGHPYDYIDTYGKRRCKKCWVAQKRKWHDKNPVIEIRIPIIND